eukprot:CCRYP_007762-RA/>CCRYP_007762-RA protein AED:0.42 eAED:0.42 QI:0/0/0/1/0/0/3/0/358
MEEKETTEKGVFQVDMSKYVKEVIEEFPEVILKSLPSPHNEHLFTVRDAEGCGALPEEQALKFHRTTAQLLRDIQTSVYFLTTRVKAPNEDDWVKLKQVLQYLKGMAGLKLQIMVNNLSHTKWFVDGAHMVHWDCKGQTGAGMMLAIPGSRRSTQRVLPRLSWWRWTMQWGISFGAYTSCKPRGMSLHMRSYTQDNKSAILLEANGKISSSKRTNIKATYFFITDKVDQGEVKIEHLPTEQKWIDVNTKLKQGTPFRVDRSYIMNCAVDLKDDTVTKEIDSMSTPTKHKRDPTMSKTRQSKGPPSMTRWQECVGSHTYYDSRGTACGRVELMKRIMDSVRRAAHRVTRSLLINNLRLQ